MGRPSRTVQVKIGRAGVNASISASVPHTSHLGCFQDVPSLHDPIFSFRSHDLMPGSDSCRSLLCSFSRFLTPLGYLPLPHSLPDLRTFSTWPLSRKPPFLSPPASFPPVCRGVGLVFGSWLFCRGSVSASVSVHRPWLGFESSTSPSCGALLCILVFFLSQLDFCLHENKQK